MSGAFHSNPTRSPAKTQPRAGRPSDLLYGYPSNSFVYNSAFEAGSPPELYSTSAATRSAAAAILCACSMVLKCDATLLHRVHSALERTLPSYPLDAAGDLTFLRKWDASIAAVKQDVRNGDAANHALVHNLVHKEVRDLAIAFVEHKRFLLPDTNAHSWAPSTDERNLAVIPRAGVLSWSNSGRDTGWQRLLATVGNSSIALSTGPDGVKTKPYAQSAELCDVIAEILVTMHTHKLQYLVVTSYAASAVFELAPGQIRMSPLIALGSNVSRTRSTGNLLTLIVALSLLSTTDQDWVDLAPSIGVDAGLKTNLNVNVPSRKRGRESSSEGESSSEIGDADVDGDEVMASPPKDNTTHSPLNHLTSLPVIPPEPSSQPQPQPSPGTPVTPKTPERSHSTTIPSAPSSQRTHPRDAFPGPPIPFPVDMFGASSVAFPLFGPSTKVRSSPAFQRLTSGASDAPPPPPGTPATLPNLTPHNLIGPAPPGPAPGSSHRNHPYATPSRSAPRTAASVPNLKRNRIRSRGDAVPPPNHSGSRTHGTPAAPGTPSGANTTHSTITPSRSVSRFRYDATNPFDTRSPAARTHARTSSVPVGVGGGTPVIANLWGYGSPSTRGRGNSNVTGGASPWLDPTLPPQRARRPTAPNTPNTPNAPGTSNTGHARVSSRSSQMSLPRSWRAFPGGGPDFVLERSASPSPSLHSSDEGLDGMQLATEERVAEMMAPSSPPPAAVDLTARQRERTGTPPQQPFPALDQVQTHAQTAAAVTPPSCASQRLAEALKVTKPPAIKNSPVRNYTLQRLPDAEEVMPGDDEDWDIPGLGTLTLALHPFLRDSTALVDLATRPGIIFSNADLTPPVNPARLHLTLEALRSVEGMKEAKWRAFTSTITLPPGAGSGFGSSTASVGTGIPPPQRTRLPVLVKLFSSRHPPDGMDANTAGWAETDVIEEAERAQNRPDAKNGRFDGFFKTQGVEPVYALVMQDVLRLS